MFRRVWARRENTTTQLIPGLRSLEEDNKRQIALIRERIARRQELEDEARAVVDDAVQRGFGGDGWIWVSNLFADGYPAKFFTSGWDSPSIG